MAASPEIRFVRARETKIKHVGDTIAVYVPTGHAIHVLNPTAHLLYELLAEPVTERELSQALELATDGDPESIAGDVARALEEFVAKGIVETESP